MIGVTALLEKIRQGKRELIANREADVLRIAFDQIALVKLRIQSRGENSEGDKFELYTPSYEKSRKKAGYQVGYVDLTRTGRLWNSIRPTVTASSIFSATVEIEPDSDSEREKLKGLSNKRENILSPSESELALVKKANRKRILQYFAN